MDTDCNKAYYQFLKLLLLNLISPNCRISTFSELYQRSEDYINVQKIISMLRRLYQRSREYIDVRGFFRFSQAKSIHFVF